jgi:hypothetical protein
MHAARGDQKPCSVTACAGTMQFGRRRDQDTRPPPRRDDPIPLTENVKGWVCSASPEHFREE